MSGAPTIAEIKRMLVDRAPAVAAHLLPAGRREKNEWRAGSLRGEPGSSFGVRLSGPKVGTWSDFADVEGNGGKNLLGLWMAARRVGFPVALDEICAWLGVERPKHDGREHGRGDRAGDHETSRRRDALPKSARPAAPAGIELPDDEARQRINRTIDRTRPLKSGLGASWLREVRDLEPDLLDEEAVRFLPGSDRYPPAVVSVITAWTDASVILGLQFTALALDGSAKLWRKFMTGSKPAGGVCRLVNDAEVTTELALGEGLESCLAVMTGQHRSGCMVRPAWAALTAGNLANLGPLPAIQRLMLLVDADDAGRKGAEKCAALWHHARREVRLATPTGTNDWNDA